MWSWLCRKLGELVARYLQTPARRYRCVPFTVNDPATLKRFLRPADVLLVEGCDRISVVIKYLTQSTWSHAAVYIGDAVDRGEGDDNACLFESDLANGAVAVPLSKYEGQNTRICRPVGLTEPDRAKVIAFLVDSSSRSSLTASARPTIFATSSISRVISCPRRPCRSDGAAAC